MDFINTDFVSYMKTMISNEYLLLFFLSMLPVTELRVSVPIGIILLKINWLPVFIICVIGNFIIGYLLIYGVGYLLFYLNKITIFRKIISRIIISSKYKYQKYDKYKRVKGAGLALFIGIPLPGTGVWSGALLSHAISLNRTYSINSMFFGLLLSGTIMTIISLFFDNWLV